MPATINNVKTKDANGNLIDLAGATIKAGDVYVQFDVGNLDDAWSVLNARAAFVNGDPTSMPDGASELFPDTSNPFRFYSPTVPAEAGQTGCCYEIVVARHEGFGQAMNVFVQQAQQSGA